jgi:prophage regulatory protein
MENRKGDSMEDRIIRLKELTDIVQLSRSTILLWERTGRFPKRAQVLPSGVAGWLSSDVQAWLRGETT